MLFTISFISWSSIVFIFFVFSKNSSITSCINEPVSIGLTTNSSLSFNFSPYFKWKENGHSLYCSSLDTLVFKVFPYSLFIFSSVIFSASFLCEKPFIASFNLGFHSSFCMYQLYTANQISSISFPCLKSLMFESI